MADSNQPVFRRTLDERHADPRRTFTFKFPTTNERAQKAREWLENVESLLYKEQQKPVPLWEIIAAIGEEIEFGKPSLLMNEKRIMHVILKRLENLDESMRELKEREPVAYQQVASSYEQRTGEKIDDAFFDAMLDDFNSKDGR